MYNEEIRNRVLVQLYKKYYEYGFAHPIDTEEVVRDTGIPSENSYSPSLPSAISTPAIFLYHLL